jgi:hypothetical protein
VELNFKKKSAKPLFANNDRKLLNISRVRDSDKDRDSVYDKENFAPLKKKH